MLHLRQPQPAMRTLRDAQASAVQAEGQGMADFCGFGGPPAPGEHPGGAAIVAGPRDSKPAPATSGGRSAQANEAPLPPAAEKSPPAAKNPAAEGESA